MNKMIYNIIKLTAETQPDKKAIIYLDEDRCFDINAVLEVNYKELFILLERYIYFIKKTIRSSNGIGMYLDRGVDSVLTSLSIYSVGGCFIPINTAYKSGKLQRVIDDINVKVMISSRKFSKVLNGLSNITVYYIEDIYSIVHEDEQEHNDEHEDRDENDYAYILYTSGSTGIPKAVPIKYRAINSFIPAMIKAYDLKKNDVILNFNLPLFDSYIEEIFGCFFSGATLVIAHDFVVSDFDLLFQYCSLNKVTVLDIPTNYWHQMVFTINSKLKNKISSLEKVIIGGDLAIDRAIELWIAQIGCDIVLINSYGPTECCIVSTCQVISNDYISGNIVGSPLEHVNLLIVDENNNELHDKKIGEVCIGGKALFSDYLNMSSKRERYLIKNNGNYYYRTGDKGFIDEFGRLVFCGRIKKSKKINGNMVDFDFMKRILNSLTGLDEIDIFVKEPNQGYQCLYISLDLKLSSINRHEILRELRVLYPKAEIPFIICDESNARGDSKHYQDSSIYNDGAYMRIINIWNNVFGDIGANIIADTNFFDIGGTSLNALMLINMIYHEFRCKVLLEDFYKKPTPLYLFDLVKKSNDDGIAFEHSRTELTDDHDQYYWIMDAIINNSPIYNIPIYFFITGELDQSKLHAVINLIVRKYPALHFSVEINDKQNRIRNCISTEESLELNTITLIEVQEQYKSTKIAKIINQMPFESLLLNKKKPVSVKLIVESCEKYHLLINFHHAFVDGLSISTLIDEISMNYNNATMREDTEQPLNDNCIYIDNPGDEKILAYWYDNLIPYVHSESKINGMDSVNLSSIVGKRKSTLITKEELLNIRNIQGLLSITIEHALIAVFLRTLSEMVEEVFLLGIPSANRGIHNDFSKIGSFATTLIMPYKKNDCSIIDDVLNVKSFLHSSTPFTNFSFTALNKYFYEKNKLRIPNIKYYFSSQLSFSYAMDLDNLTCELRKIPVVVPKGDLALEIFRNENGIMLDWLYNPLYFNDEQIEVIIDCFNKNLEILLNGNI
ncbi:AMP-binding protein [Intestinirhabdus alba]|uniref:AMP-binding protein n=1 Tax=Intestinirhabdus alba TaxID=2899544 RepID=A0A6L6IP53_9ENTR|nr:AMP-binding protein [Intestinirhabdus alba]MTH48279.1 AMP-binding protein [Intestinirhabdus alba]